MQIFASFIFAFGFSFLFLTGYKGKALSTSYVTMFFLALFMTGLATHFWIVPVGPRIYGVSWMPILFMEFIIALLFAAPSPYHHKGARSEAKEPADSATFPISAGVFTWILLLVLFTAIIAGLYRGEPGSGLVNGNLDK